MVTLSAPGDESLGEVVRWLRQERETARQELALSQQEAMRLRQDCTRHQREAAAAQAEAQAARDRTRQEVRGREEHTAHLQRLDQLNLLRESNTTLRWGCWTLPSQGQREGQLTPDSHILQPMHSRWHS